MKEFQLIHDATTIQKWIEKEEDFVEVLVMVVVLSNSKSPPSPPAPHHRHRRHRN
jgi:hypothetical protein